MSNIFMPQLWTRDEGSGVSQNWVTANVSTELSKSSRAYLKSLWNESNESLLLT